MCTSSFCKAKVNVRYAIAVAVLGALLFIDGVTLVVIGSVWDSITSGSSQLYIIREKQGGYDYENGAGDSSILMYEGLLVCIPAVPAFLLLCKRVRSTAVLFLLSLLIAFIGSILAAVFSGISWTSMQIVYQSYKDGNCERVETQCTCKLPNGFAQEKTATMFFADCHKIDTLHSIVNIYFALSIVACLLTTVSSYLGCVGCCNPEEEQKETTRLVNSEPPCYSSVYNPAAHQGIGFNGGGMVPSHAYAPPAPEGATGGGIPEPYNSGIANMAPQQPGPQGWMKEEEKPLVSF